MLQPVNVGHKSLADYATIATRGLMDEIKRLGEPLAGKRVAHVSATAFGGGVAEINYTLVPLMQSAGLEVDWLIIRGADEFFNVTKTIHNALQGNPQGLDGEQQAIFRRYNESNAKELVDDYDFVIIHDAQPGAIAPEPCLAEGGKMLDGDLRSQTWIFLYKSSDLLHQWSCMKMLIFARSQTLEKFLIDKSSKLFFAA